MGGAQQSAVYQALRVVVMHTSVGEPLSWRNVVVTCGSSPAPMPSEHKELISTVGSLCPVEHLVSSFLKKKDIRELGILCSLYALAIFCLTQIVDIFFYFGFGIECPLFNIDEGEKPLLPCMTEMVIFL